MPLSSTGYLKVILLLSENSREIGTIPYSSNQNGHRIRAELAVPANEDAKAEDPKVWMSKALKKPRHCSGIRKTIFSSETSLTNSIWHNCFLSILPSRPYQTTMKRAHTNLSSVVLYVPLCR